MNYCEECQEVCSVDKALCVGCELDARRRLAKVREALLRQKGNPQASVAPALNGKRQR